MFAMTSLGHSTPAHAVTAGFAFALIMFAASMRAADAYPNKAIRWIVPFPSGSLLDVRSRFVAAQLSEQFKQQVVVDNRPGAGGIVGTQLAKTVPADGYTVALGTISTLAINPSLYLSLPYDPERDFTPVILIASGPLVLVVSSALAANTVTELISLARSKPRKLVYASIGNGSTQHVTMELFKQISSTQLRHIPLKRPGRRSPIYCRAA